MDPLLLLLEAVRFGGVACVLGLGAYQDLTRTAQATDIKGRTFDSGVIDNRLWLYVFMGLALTLVEQALFFNWVLLVLSLASIGLAVFFGLLLFVFHGWGGADAKAFMLIGFSAPLFPVWGVLYPFPCTLAVLLISCGLAVVYSLFFQKGAFNERHLRFLPFMLIGFLVCLI